MPVWSLYTPSYKVLLLSLLLVYTIQLGISDMMRFVQSPVLALPLLGASRQASPPASDSAVDVSWYPSLSTKINNLDSVINGTGIYGFIFDSSTFPEGTPYNTYNWCNMPHVRATEYPTVNSSYELVYVEVSILDFTS